MTTNDLRFGANNRAVWTGNTMRIKTEAYYCPDCDKYFAHPELDSYNNGESFPRCPTCGTDWIDHLWLNLDTRNFYHNPADECFDLTDITYDLEYAKEEYEDQEIYTVDDWIDCATDMGGDCSEIDMDQVREDLAKEKTIDHPAGPVVE